MTASVELPTLRRRVKPTAVSVKPGADIRTHTTQVRLELPPGEPDVYPGMFARAHFVVGRATKVLIPAAAIVGWVDGASGEHAWALTAMAIGLTAHMLVPALFAAPALLAQRRTRPDDERALAALFDRFQRWHLVRTLIDVGTLGATVWALVATMPS